MQLTDARPAMALPPLAALVLKESDLPGFRNAYHGTDEATNEAVAARSDEPERHLRRLLAWGRLDGCAARFIPVSRLLPTHPIVVDSSAARFSGCAGAMQALLDETAFPSGPGVRRLFPRNIAENTECLHTVYEEDGEKFSLYRVDFRVGNVLGSLGVVWRYPHGGPMQALKLAERQAMHMRTACNVPAARNPASAQRAGVQVLSPHRKEGELGLVREA